MGDTLASQVRIREDDAMPWPTLTMNESRREFVRRALMRDVNIAALCRQFGISRKTAYKWLARGREDGLNGLRERSRRPLRSATRLDEDVVCALGKLKLAHLRWGPLKIRTLYQRLYGAAPSVSSCHRVLQKLGLVQKRRRRVRSGGPSFVGVPVAQHPNHVWTLDFKGWWTLASGERCEPLTVCDAYSRMVLATVVPTASGFASMKRIFIQLFTQYGLPEILHTDNGSPFACTRAPLGLTRLSAWWISLGIELVRNRPGHPQDNPSHERMHGDIEQEISGCVQEDRRAQQAALDLWRQEYNHVRPHQSLGQRCPAEIYHRSERKYREAEPDYGPGFKPRKVSHCGMISWRRHRIFISLALAGHTVGLRRAVDNQLELWLHHVLVGHIDLQTYSFRAAPSRGSERVRLTA